MKHELKTINHKKGSRNIKLIFNFYTFENFFFLAGAFDKRF